MARASQVHYVQSPIDQTGLPRQRRIKPSFLREALKQSAKQTGLSGRVTASLVITDDATVKNINKSDRGIDAPTDVISYSMLEGGYAQAFPGEALMMGEIVISLDTAERQAREDGVSLHHMLAWLIAHGMLHLAGYDHRDSQERQAMYELEKISLRLLGFSSIPAMFVPSKERS